MRFHVALWRVWSCTQSVSFLPDYLGEVEAPSAFLAIAGMMQLHRLRSVPHAAAIAHDGSLAYRVYRLWLGEPVHQEDGPGAVSQQQKSAKQGLLGR